MSINSDYLHGRRMAAFGGAAVRGSRTEDGDSSSYSTDEEMAEGDMRQLLGERRHPRTANQLVSNASPALLPAMPSAVYPQLVPHYIPVAPGTVPGAAILTADGRVVHNTQYGSVSSTAPSARHKPKTKRYRMPFLILIVFNFGLVAFLSIICYESGGSPSVPSINYFTLHLRHYYFDLVLIAAFKFLLNSLLYLLMGWVTRVVMAITTLIPTLYVPLKAYYCWPLKDSDGGDDFSDISVLVILFVSFAMPWAEAFFFEFKYLPAELSRLHSTSWRDWRFWLWPRALEEESEDTPSLSDMESHNTQRPTYLHVPQARPSLYAASTISLDFRTPMGSTRTSPIPTMDYLSTAPDEDLPPITEERSPSNASPLTQHTTLSPENRRYKVEGETALQQLMEFTSGNDGWKHEKTTKGVTILSGSWKGKKMWKAECEMLASALQLWAILYPGDDPSQWNPQCSINQTVYRVDQDLDVVYSVSTSVGPVSSRDFVSVRQISVSNGCYYSASCATKCHLKPPQPGKVRGENGPCGYKVVPISENRSLFIWVLNTDLKGWLPQSVIDQTLCGVMIGTFQKLNEFIEQKRQDGTL